MPFLRGILGWLSNYPEKSMFLQVKFAMLLLSFLWRLGWTLRRRMAISRHSPQQDGLIVVGSMRMGGGGKTPFVDWLAGQLQAQGLRVAVLCYAVYRCPPKGVAHVMAASDACFWSDEAAWLADRYETWVARDFGLAWQQLCKRKDLDVVVADGGWEHPSLQAAFRILLDWGERAKSMRDLFPYGECRSLRGDHRVDLTLLCSGESGEGEVRFVLNSVRNGRGESFQGDCEVFCGIGQPQRFLHDLSCHGFVVKRFRALPDHARILSRILELRLPQARIPIVITTKDAMRLSPAILAHPLLFVAQQRLQIPRPDSILESLSRITYLSKS